MALHGCDPAVVQRYDPNSSKDDPFHWAQLMERMAPVADSSLAGRHYANGGGGGGGGGRASSSVAATMRNSAWIQRVWRYLAFSLDGGLPLGYVSFFGLWFIC